MSKRITGIVSPVAAEAALSTSGHSGGRKKDWILDFLRPSQKWPGCYFEQKSLNKPERKTPFMIVREFKIPFLVPFTQEYKLAIQARIF
jgi:hypothetical protein